MNSLIGDSPLFRKIMASILLASVFFLTLLTAIVYYSNEILEDDLLARQTEYELKNIQELLAQNPQAPLPRSANLNIYLDSRKAGQPVPEYLADLNEGVHHDVKVDDKAYHVMIAAIGGDRVYIQSDITEIERSEELLSSILLVAWAVLLIMMFVIARLLSQKLSEPIALLSRTLAEINPDQRGIRLSERFEDDEVGRIAQAFDSYTEKMDDYVEKQMAFAAMASHELRSPLTIVQTSADLISCRREQDSDIKPHLEKIQRATTSMANMIHALLAVTRDQPTRKTEQHVELKALVDEVAESTLCGIEDKKIRFENRVPGDAFIEADRTLINVILTNLIKNSIKHGGLSVIAIDARDGILSIVDNGIGIDRKMLENVFDLGHRGQQSQGYGIGLYISRLICDYQGWDLELLPNPQGGTIARIHYCD